MTRYRVNGVLAHGDPVLEPDEDGRLVPKRDRRTGQPLNTSREYHDGDYFEHDDADLVRQLHRQGAISTEEEYAQAQYAAGNLRPLQDLAEERERAQRLAEENAALRVQMDGLAQRLAEMEALQATPPGGTFDPATTSVDAEAEADSASAKTSRSKKSE